MGKISLAILSVGPKELCAEHWLNYLAIEMNEN